MIYAYHHNTHLSTASAASPSPFHAVVVLQDSMLRSLLPLLSLLQDSMLRSLLPPLSLLLD
jgi:hypothetical protein